MTARSILNTFDCYKKSRIAFVQSVADYALREENISILLESNVFDLLSPLLNDACPQVQQCAVIAIGRIAHHVSSVGPELLRRGVINTMLTDMATKSKHYKRGAMFTLRAICKHSQETTQELINAGVLNSVLECLVDFDSGVREAAAWACGYVARHSADLARAVVQCGAVPHLVHATQEPDLCIRRVAASAIADIAKHDDSLGLVLMDANVIGYLVNGIEERDNNLKRQCLLALTCLARHSNILAEAVVQAEIFPTTLILMAHKCPLVRRNAAMLVRDVVKHSVQLAELLMNSGGIGALVEVIQNTATTCDADDHRIPAITALGYISGHGDHLAKCVVKCDAVPAVHHVFTETNKMSDLAPVCVWTLGQIGRYCPMEVAQSGVLAELLEESICTSNSEEMRIRAQNALKQCINNCRDLMALEPLIKAAPPELMPTILHQLTKILPLDPAARRLFVTCGGLKRVQEIQFEPGSPTSEYITLINACYPEEIVRFYTPGYPDLLLEKVDGFIPEIPYDEMGPVPSRTSVNSTARGLFDD